MFNSQSASPTKHSDDDAMKSEEWEELKKYVRVREASVESITLSSFTTYFIFIYLV